MPQLPFVTLDVFTRTRYAGNPLAVVKVPPGRQVSQEQMQIIAREFNLSETIFIHEDGKDGSTEWRVRIFLTTGEIPFAGHPTIGCAVYALNTLANGAGRGRFLANAGPIDLESSSGVVTASIPHNFHKHTQYPFSLADMLDLQPALKGILTSQDRIATVSPVKGMNFVMVELPHLEALAAVTTSRKPAPKLDDAWNVGFSGTYFYVFTPTPTTTADAASHPNDSDDAGEVETTSLRTRMIEGAMEDPATGSAACALASFLSLQRANRRTPARFAITQAVEMGRRSEIGVKISLNAGLDGLEKVELSGEAVRVMEGVVEY